MKYMLIIAGADDAWSHLSEAEQRTLYDKVGAWWGEHSASGEILDGHELQPGSTATTIRRGPSGEVTVTDGPFVEGKEMVAGYGILDVPDLDAAIRLASSWPAPDTLEIRPIVERQA
ncbi:MAG: YciI family protein [Chloroflexota bacterium]|nr:YciI family protein [Chloroflexota bacterium]